MTQLYSELLASLVGLSQRTQGRREEIIAYGGKEKKRVLDVITRSAHHDEAISRSLVTPVKKTVL